MSEGKIILGGGITGLTSGICTGYTVYEKEKYPGGICASYFLDRNGRKYSEPTKKETYRFEIGGGHWISGASRDVTDFLSKFSKFRSYARNCAVFLPELDLFIPYPIQYNLHCFPSNLRRKILSEAGKRKPRLDGKKATLREWLEASFGPTLCKIFFFPFHNLYTDGLFNHVSCRDMHNTPSDKRLIKKPDPLQEGTGYNAEFIYPVGGLNSVISEMAGRCRIFCKKEAVKIDTRRRLVLFSDGESVKYETIITTVPLHKMLKLCGIKCEGDFAYTSVLVLNLAARKGKRCPDKHWIYMPVTKSGFYRMGFYSNVDRSFLPESADEQTVSMYIEKAFRGGKKITKNEEMKLAVKMISEIKDMGFISEIQVFALNWIDVAYTWSYPGSSWREKAIQSLEKNSIYPAGRFGRWKFDGIAKCVEDAMI